MLAEKTGWQLDYIVWDLPISVLAQLEHAILFASGVRTIRATDKDKVMAELDSLLEEYAGYNNIRG